MGPSRHIGYILHILDCLGQDMQVLYLGRAPRTKETLPDFLKWSRVTRPPLVFRGLTGSQQTPGFWGITQVIISYEFCQHFKYSKILLSSWVNLWYLNILVHGMRFKTTLKIY